MVSVLEGCSEGCGIAAALLAVLSWGTFGVPIKCNVDVEVNFFVMQSYKTLVCFLTSWFVIFLGEPVRWTPWGIVSGLFWVPGAACGIYGIRNAGVAVAIGTWSSIQVITSCIFGIIIFQEKVKDPVQTLIAIAILTFGLLGMSRYSDPSIDSSSVAATNTISEYQPVSISDIVSDGVATIPFPPAPRILKRTPSNPDVVPKVIPFELESTNPGDSFSEPLLLSPSEDKDHRKDRMVSLLGGRISMTQRQLGMLGAVVNGAWGGLNLIPLHFAQRDSGMSGASYLISYATGSMIVCIGIWFLMFFYHYRHHNSVSEAIEQLPAWHVKELGLPGMLAGLFYSVGNFCSILAVAYLGQGVGFSFCQGQLLISGLWGVFYFKEIQGRDTITKWFASASITIVGIIWLSAQHEGSGGHR
eukprot:scaffold1136_cov146-Cylindrotheca_fusiformis.AAC.28